MSAAIDMREASPVQQHRQVMGRRQHDGAFRSKGAHARLWILAGAGVAADLASKHWALSTLEVATPRHWIPHLLDFQLSLNAGALFGLGSGRGELFIVASVAALGFVLYLFAGTARTQWVVHVALALVLAGALGNLYDRAFMQYDMVRVSAAGALSDVTVIGEVVDDGVGDVIAVRPWFEPARVISYQREDLKGPVRRGGVVRDFLKFTPRIGGRTLWPWVFNLADAFLVVGVALLLLSYLSRARGLEQAVRTDAPDSAGA